MKDQWVYFKNVNFRDIEVRQYHVDTRDFCIFTNSEKGEELPDIETLSKYGNRFFYTSDEAFDLIERYHYESGGDKKWRMFFLEGDGSWNLKYLRIYRTHLGMIICDSYNRALKRETTSRRVGKTEYD